VGAGGIKIGVPLTDMHGVLTGVPTLRMNGRLDHSEHKLPSA
jgi:hypothetical protein